MMTLSDAQAYCTTLTKRSGSNFYYPLLLLPRLRREAMYTVYAFCREVDNAVDEPPAGTDPKAQITHWRAELDAAYHGHPTHPVTISLAEHNRRLNIPQKHFEDLIAGMEMDLHNTRYATFDDLSVYCYRVASVVGLISLHVFETLSPLATRYAIDLGMAFQMTNILRDLRSDAERGRIYLPLEDLARFGYRESDLLARTYNPNFVELLRFECGRAQGFYTSARQSLEALPRADQRALTVAEAFRGVYSRILRRIERSNYRVFGPRITIPRAYRVAIGVGIWLRSRFT